MRRPALVSAVVLSLSLLAAAGEPAGGAADRPLLELQADRANGHGGAPPAIARLELAGNALDAYPYFDYVATFNADAEVRIGVDPVRHRELLGRSCDVWVVRSRAASGWRADPVLVDATGNGPLTHTFGGTSIRDNTLVVASPFGLDADAGAGLGAGYDVVLDCDRDGRLGHGDLVDGAWGGAAAGNGTGNEDNTGAEAGFYVVHDLTAPGPLAVSEIDYSVGAVFDIPAGFTRERTYFPTAIAGMGRLPLIVVSHGNGHSYDWYGHIGAHLASYGYVVMSHENDVVPGIDPASTTTLGHTDAILDQQSTIAGGVLDGHLDAHRIVWIGHSRGAEAIVRAYDRIVEGQYVPTHYGTADLVLLSSMLPTNFTGADPHGASFHLWTASGDDDVDGGPGNPSLQTFHLFERGRGFRQSTIVQAAGHGDFHTGPDSVFAGPCHLTPKEEIHKIIKAHLLALVEQYVRNNPAARDFLWRQYESLAPMGAPEGVCAVVSHEYRQPSAASRVIDDYQTEPAPGVSSSGAAVSYTVSGVFEGLLRDGDGDFTWTASDPMNGMTRATATDGARGVVFEWTAPAWYELEIPAAWRDLSALDFLSLRACQQSRHPLTTGEIGDLGFGVTLRDAGGTSSTIDIAGYGGGIEEPFLREGGWFNEFETVRIRLGDFLRDGSGLRLTDVVAIRFEFGGAHGSSAGRIGIDAIELTRELAPPLPGAVAIRLPDGDPDPLPPGEPADFTLRVTASGEPVVPGSPRLVVREGEGNFEPLPAVALGDDLYRATLPPVSCGESIEYYLAARGEISGQVTLPAGAPWETIRPEIGRLVTRFEDDFESDRGWVAENLGATAGNWERGVPVDDPMWEYDPAADADGSGRCWLTENRTGNTDVDGGAVRLTSPPFDLDDPTVRIEYAYFLRLTNDDGSDRMLVELDPGDGSWVELTRHDTDGGLLWHAHTIDRAAIDATGVTPSAASRLRFTVNDGAPSSIVEAGLDAFRVSVLECDSAAKAGTAAGARNPSRPRARDETPTRVRAIPPRGLDRRQRAPRTVDVESSQPVAVERLIAARPFTVDRPFEFRWRAERPEVRSGWLVVLAVDPALVQPRQAAEPVLYVGDQTAQRLNVGSGSGRLVALVPAPIDLARAPIWFGAPQLPERVDEETIAAERAVAERAGIVAFRPEDFAAARARGGGAIRVTDHAELLRRAAALIGEHAPDETRLADRLRASPDEWTRRPVPLD